MESEKWLPLVRMVGGQGDSPWKGTLSEVLEMLFISVWGGLMWVYIYVKFHQAVHLRFVHIPL